MDKTVKITTWEEYEEMDARYNSLVRKDKLLAGGLTEDETREMLEKQHLLFQYMKESFKEYQP